MPRSGKSDVILHRAAPRVRMKDLHVVKGGDLNALAVILENLCVPHLQEIGVSGMDAPEYAEKLADHATNGECHILYFDGKPQAALAIKEERNFGPVVWCVATDAYFQHFGPSILRLTRKGLAEVYSRLGPMHAVVGSPHPFAEKWTKAMGFQKLGEQGPLKIFLYDPI